jgi:SAM-dependent methyltransferase
VSSATLAPPTSPDDPRARRAQRPGPGRGFFDAWSRVYDLDWVQRAVYRPEQDAVLDALRAEGARRVLDLGCGTGQLAHRLRLVGAGLQVVGCDFSAGMLRQARTGDRAVDWVQGDAMRLPFAAARFDAVVSTQAFHWFPDRAAALHEVARVLRPGGCLVLTLVRPALAAVRWIVEVGARLLGEPFRWPDGAALARDAAAAGLRIERERRVLRLPGLLLLPPVLTLARRLPKRASDPA